MTITVLAGSYQETNAFARQKGLGYGVRHVVNAAALRGARPRELHVLPSYYKRRDIHAVDAAVLRIARKNPNLKRIEYEVLPGGIYAPADSEISLDTSSGPETFAGDMSPDAVPGQTALEEHLEPVAAHQSPRVVPDGDLLDFLDD